NLNALGCVCQIRSLFFFWRMLQTLTLERCKPRRIEILLTGMFLMAIWWLLTMAHSSTSLVSLFLGVLFVIILGLRFVNKRLIGTYMIAAIVIYVLAEATFGISGRVTEL